MRLLIAIFLVLLVFAPDSPAQISPDDHELLQSTPMVRRPGLPVLTIETQNQFLMRSFAPDFYSNERQIASDIRWVKRNDSAFVALVDSLSDSIMAMIEDYSGIKWIEPTIRVHLVKYASVEGMYNPLVFPLQGIKKKHYDEVIPTGYHQLFNIVKYLAGRNLMQADLPGKTRLHIADHPLMQKTSYRFEVMALTVAVTAAQSIIPPDTLENIFSSGIWKRHNPGWPLYQDKFADNWILTPDTPLVVYLAEEPYSSPLVYATRPPKLIRQQETTDVSEEPVKMSAGGGELGFSVFKNDRKYLEVTSIDTTKLAYLSGLRIGDQIKRVNGEYSRNARDLMGRILDKIDNDGVYLIIVRDDEETGLLLMPPVEEYSPTEEF